MSIGTITGHSYPTFQGRLLFVASDGDLFAIGETGSTISVYRSTDGGSTWGSAVTTTAGTNAIAAISGVAFGSDLIAVAWSSDSHTPSMSNPSRDIEYQEFNMATNSWSGSVDSVGTFETDIAPEQEVIGICARTSDRVIIHASQHTDMGSSTRDIAISHGTSGSWTTNVRIGDSNGDRAKWGVIATGSDSDDAHIVFHMSPSGSGGEQGRTLNGSDSLSTRVDLVFTDTAGVRRAQQFVSWDDGGTQRINTSNFIAFGHSTVQLHGEDGSLDITGDEDPGSDPFGGTDQAVALVVDEDEGDLYALRAHTDADLFYNVAAGGAKANFGSPIELEDGVSVGNLIDAIWFTHTAGNGGDQVIGYIFFSSGSTKYGELVLVAGSAIKTITEAVGVTDSVTLGFKTITEPVGVTDSVTARIALDEFSTTRPAYWNFGVWRNSTGDAYTATAQAGSDQHRRLTIWKSTDDGAKWEAVHTFTPVTGTYTNSGAPFTMCMGLLDNDILHIFWNPDEDTRDKELQYCAWDTTNDTVEFAPEVAYAVGVIGRTIGSGNVGIRSGGELVCAFREDPDDGDGEMTMIRGTQGSWTIHDGVSDGDGISAGSWAVGLSVADNDDVHVTWSGNSVVIHRVLRANNTLSTIDANNAVAVSAVSGPGFSEIFDGKLFYARLSSNGTNFTPTMTDGTVAEDISFTNRHLDLDIPDRNGAVVGISCAKAGGRLIMGWVQEDTQEAVWLEYNPSTDLWGTTPQGTGVTVTEAADVIFDAWVRGGNVYVLVLERIDDTNDDNQRRTLTEDLIGAVVTGTAKTETVTDDTDPTDLITRVHDAERTPIDAVGVTDATTRIHDAERVPVDPIGVTDSATPVKSITVAISEAMGVTDLATPVKTATSTIVEILGVTDSTTRIAPAIRSVVEGVAIADATSNDETNRETLTEPIGVADLVVRTAPAIRSVVEPIGVTDDATPVKTIQVSIIEAIGVIDSTARIHPAKRTPIEAIGVTDLIAPVKTITPEITETVGVTDSTPFTLQITFEISEDMGVTDLITRIAPVIRAIVEGVAVQDAVSDDETNRETLTEPIGVTDLIARLAPAIRSVVEALGVADLISLIKSITVAITEPVGVTDVIASAKTITPEISESVGVTDVATPAKTITVSISETLGVTDSTTPIKSITIVITETLGVTDSTPFSLEGGLTEAVVDPVGVTDSTTQIHAAVRSVVEAIGTTDATASVKTITVAITEVMGVTDTTPFSLQIAVTISNGVEVTDSTTRVAPAVRVIAEGVVVQDVISDSETNRETVTEPISVTDLIARVHTAFRTIANDADVTDLITAIKTIQIEISEAMGLTDLISPAKTVPVGITDLMGVTDSTIVAKTIQVSISESIGVIDNTVGVLSGATLRSVVDPIGITDSTTRTWTIVRSITESVGVTDLAIKGEVNEEVAIETLGVTDAASPAKSSVRSVTEVAGVTDSIEVVLSIAREIIESTGVEDDTSRVAVVARALAENVGVTTALDRTVDWTRILADNVNVTDVVLAIDQAPSSLVPLATVLSDEPLDTLKGDEF